jgi:hypothetical protein
MATFVVTAQQPKRVGIPDLERPQVQDALQMSAQACHSAHIILPRY